MVRIKESVSSLKVKTTAHFGFPTSKLPACSIYLIMTNPLNKMFVDFGT